MPTTKKKSTQARARTRSNAAPSPAAARLSRTWKATLSRLTAAQKEAERQVKLLVKRNRLTTGEATSAVKALKSRLQRERKKAARELQGRLTILQARLVKERKNVARVAEDAVHGTLAALNIPSRVEVAELTRKVEELSRKIEGFRSSRPAGKRLVKRSAVAVVPAPAA